MEEPARPVRAVESIFVSSGNTSIVWKCQIVQFVLVGAFWLCGLKKKLPIADRRPYSIPAPLSEASVV